jgi:pyrroline-5-carboxylate reductase
MKLGFIGCGKMGAALLQGTLSAGAFTPGQIFVSDSIAKVAESLSELTGAVLCRDNASLVENCDTVLLCVKPPDAVRALGAVREVKKPALVISIVAGIPIRTLQLAAGESARIVRVMPNTPALVGKGAAAFATGDHVTEDDVRIVKAIMGSVGTVAAVQEKLLDAVTGLSGSGPAYVYVIIEALADAGVRVGLPRELAQTLAAQTLAGGAEMVLRTGKHPGQLKDMVTSPGGTTIAGLEALEAGGLRASLYSAVRAATQRSKELSGT